MERLREEWRMVGGGVEWCITFLWVQMHGLCTISDESPESKSNNLVTRSVIRDITEGTTSRLPVKNRNDECTRQLKKKTL